MTTRRRRRIWRALRWTGGAWRCMSGQSSGMGAVLCDLAVSRGLRIDGGWNGWCLNGFHCTSDISGTELQVFALPWFTPCSALSAFSPPPPPPKGTTTPSLSLTASQPLPRFMQSATGSNSNTRHASLTCASYPTTRASRAARCVDRHVSACAHHAMTWRGSEVIDLTGFTHTCR